MCCDNTRSKFFAWKNGCPNSATIELISRTYRNHNVFIPNAFTPDDNGTNDVFTITDNPTIASIEKLQIFDRWGELIWENRPQPILEVLEVALKSLTNRDFRTMDEKHVQAMFYAYLNISRMYETKSEYESERKYFDIVMLETPIAEAKYEFIFELKYAKQAGDIRIETIKNEATTQIKTYLTTKELLHHPKMKAWVVVIVGDTVEVCDEVFL